MVGEFRTVEQHLAGLQRMVRLRGGLGGPSFSAYQRKLLTMQVLRYLSVPYSDVHNSTETTCRRIIESIKPQAADIAPKADLEYPSHPFSPQICEIVSTLPLGFERVALTTKLSKQVIEIITVFETTLVPRPSESAKSPRRNEQLDFQMMNSIILDDVSALEHCICAALTKYQQSFTKTADSNPVNQQYLQAIFDFQASTDQITRFFSMFQQSVEEHYNDKAILDCLIWVALVTAVAETAPQNASTGPLVLIQQISKFDNTFQSWDRFRTLLCQFFYDDALLEQGEKYYKLNLLPVEAGQLPQQSMGSQAPESARYGVTLTH